MAEEAAAESLPPALELQPVGPVSMRLAAPASKSVTNRALLCAALAEGTSRLHDAAPSDDAQAMATALAELGAVVHPLFADGGLWTTEDPSFAIGLRSPTGGPGAEAGGPGAEAGGSGREAGGPGAEAGGSGREGGGSGVAWTVRGTGGRPASPDGPLDAQLSGTTMRFLAAVATLTPAGATVTGRPPLLRRPVGPLVAALRALGAGITDAGGGLPPVTAAGGGLEGGRATVDAARSSQFASAVLLVAPYARRAVLLRVERLGAAAYVELTAELMGRFGATVEPAGPAAWRVGAGRPYQAADLRVEYDASAAAHLFALAAATGGSVTVTNAAPGTLQPDTGLPALLEQMGATVTRDGPALTVRGPEALDPVDADLAAMPDQVTTVAALAALADGTSRVRGVAVARGHETDRLAVLAAELAKLGLAVQEQPDGLVVGGRGPAGPRPARLATHGDHRMAMALAAVGARVPGLVIEDPGCVAKTYPRFWHDLAAAGLAWRAHPGPVQ